MLLAFWLACLHTFSVWADIPDVNKSGATKGISDIKPVCPIDSNCLPSKEARQQWAEERGCVLLEEVCDKVPTRADPKALPIGDRGFWGSLWGGVVDLWNGITDAVVYAYEFAKGLLAGIGKQIGDLWDLVTSPIETFNGLIALGKALYNDPKGTLDMLGGILGQGVVNTIAKVMQCGPYDLGKVIGEWINPVLLVRLGAKLSRYAGDIKRAIKELRHEFGCTSFVAGTLIWTPQGLMPIEQIQAGQQVLSRHESSYADAPQRVNQTFNRRADHYYRLTTEFDQLQVTGEHPFWVQGKGWVEARHLDGNDVIAAYRGDVRVVENERVAEPLPVYNFSVDKTPSYFAGTGGVWVHNASICDITKILAEAKARLSKTITDIRAKLPSDLKRGGNVAAAEIEIPGVSKQLAAHSRIGDAADAAQHGLVGVGEPNFKVLDLGDNIPRTADTEYKILNEIARQLGNNTAAEGRITLLTELKPCDSCLGVIDQFRQKYPNIAINILDNNGVRLIP